MLRPTATKVLVLSETELLVTFDTGERRVFDAGPFMDGEWFGRLGDPDYFSQVRVNGYAVEWPDGQDISPEDLYGMSVPVAETKDEERHNGLV